MSAAFERIARDHLAKMTQHETAMLILRPCVARVLRLHTAALEARTPADQMPDVEINETEYRAFCVAYDHDPDTKDSRATLFGMPLKVVGGHP